MVGKVIVTPQPKTASPLTGAIGVIDQLVAGDSHRVVELGFFDWRIFRILAVRLHGVRSVSPSRPP